MIVCCLRDCRKEVANRPEASELKELAEHPLPVSELQEVALPAQVEFLTYLGGQSIQLVKLLACDTSDFLEVVPESLKRSCSCSRVRVFRPESCFNKLCLDDLALPICDLSKLGDDLLLRKCAPVPLKRLRDEWRKQNYVLDRSPGPNE